MTRLAAVVLALMAVFGVGCALSPSGGESGDDGSGTRYETYEATDWGFALRYDAERFTVSTDLSALSPALGDLFGSSGSGEGDSTHYVRLTDEKTPDNGAHVAGALGVAVMQLPVDVGHEGEALLKNYLLDSRRAFTEGMPGVRIGRAHRETLKCGEAAWVIRFDGPDPDTGTEGTALVFHIIEGDNLYRLQLQAPSEVWDEEEAALRSQLDGLQIQPATDEAGALGGEGPRRYISSKFDFVFKYPRRFVLVAEEATGKREFTVQLRDTQQSLSISAAVFVGPAPFALANAESDSLDYGPVAESVAKQEGVSKVLAASLITLRGKKAWQMDYLSVDDAGQRLRTRMIDIWDGKRLYSLVLQGRRGQWAQDIAALSAIAGSFTLR